MILDAPAILAPSAAYKYGGKINASPDYSCRTIMGRVRNFTASPTAPSPNIATVEPFGGFATLIDAPRPKERMATQHLNTKM